MTIIEKYYDTGKMTIQVDRTETRCIERATERYDLYETPCESEIDLKEYFRNIEEKYKRLPDIR